MTIRDSELMPLAQFLIQPRAIEEITKRFYISPATALRYIRRLRDAGHNVKTLEKGRNTKYVILRTRLEALPGQPMPLTEEWKTKVKAQFQRQNPGYKDFP
jgi:predicted DNA-binding transcriptional regulator YafY